MPVTERVEYLYYANKLIISISSGGIARYWNPESGALFKEVFLLLDFIRLQYYKVFTTKQSKLTDCARLYSKSIIFCAMSNENGVSDLIVFRERKPLSETKSTILVEKIITNEGNKFSPAFSS